MDHDDTHEWAELGRAAIDGVVVVGADGRVRVANDVAAAMLERTADELRGVDLAGLLVTPAERLLERPAGTRIEGVLRTARGGELPVHVWLCPAKAGGRAVVLRDASEWEVAKSTLSLVATGVEHAADSFEITDAEGHIEYANGAHATLTGASLFEAMGEHVNRFVDDAAGREEIARAISAAVPWRGEVRCRRKDGALRWQELTLTPVFDGRGNVVRFAVIRRDVTARVELEREAEELRAELAVVERSSIVGRLAASVAHEVNNPATSILANLEVARDEVDQIAREIEVARVSMPPEAVAVLEEWWRKIRIDERLGSLRDTLADCRDGTERVVHLVRDLRSLIRRDETRTEVVGFDDVVRAAARIARSYLGGRADLSVSLASSARVRGDRRHLGQVVIAVLVNAAQSIEPGGDGNRIDVRTFLRGGDVYLVVEDTGPGVKPEHLARLFDPFFSERAFGMSGLGLAVSRDIIEGAGGEIRVESEGPGKRVIVRIPAVPEDALNPAT